MTEPSINKNNENKKEEYQIKNAKYIEINKQDKVADKINTRSAIGFGIFNGIASGLMSGLLGGAPWYLSILFTLLSGAICGGAAYGIGKLDNLTNFANSEKVVEDTHYKQNNTIKNQEYQKNKEVDNSDLDKNTHNIAPDGGKIKEGKNLENVERKHVSEIDNQRKVADDVSKRRALAFGIFNGIATGLMVGILGNFSLVVALLSGVATAFGCSLITYGSSKIDNFMNFGKPKTIIKNISLEKETVNQEIAEPEKEIDSILNNRYNKKVIDVSIKNNLKTTKNVAHSK